MLWSLAGDQIETPNTPGVPFDDLLTNEEVLRLERLGLRVRDDSRQAPITLDELKRMQKMLRERLPSGLLGHKLTELGYVEESELTQFLSKQYGVPSVNLAEFEIEPAIVELVPREVAERHLLIPVNRAGASIVIAMFDPSNSVAIEEVRSLTGYNVETVVSSEAGIRIAIDRSYPDLSGT